MFSELLKHTVTYDDDYRLLYYRDADKYEVDVVIESRAGQLLGVEVKASATVKERNLRGLKKTLQPGWRSVHSMCAATMVMKQCLWIATYGLLPCPHSGAPKSRHQ